MDGLVIECSLPVDGEKKDSGYCPHWYGGVTPMPGTGEVVGGRYVKPLPTAFWSPYFEDAHIFDKAEDAIKDLTKIIGDSIGATIVRVRDSKYQESWK